MRKDFTLILVKFWKLLWAFSYFEVFLQRLKRLSFEVKGKREPFHPFKQNSKKDLKDFTFHKGK